jgi:hypothetical protein
LSPGSPYLSVSLFAMAIRDGNLQLAGLGPGSQLNLFPHRSGC